MKHSLSDFYAWLKERGVSDYMAEGNLGRYYTEFVRSRPKEPSREV
jgi:hypothetical protein